MEIISRLSRKPKWNKHFRGAGMNVEKYANRKQLNFWMKTQEICFDTKGRLVS